MIIQLKVCDRYQDTFPRTDPKKNPVALPQSAILATGHSFYKSLKPVLSPAVNLLLYIFQKQNHYLFFIQNYIRLLSLPVRLY
jgi:hypothetical protein